MTRKYITALLICLSILTCNGGGEKTPNSAVRKYAWDCFKDLNAVKIWEKSPTFVPSEDLRDQFLEVTLHGVPKARRPHDVSLKHCVHVLDEIITTLEYVAVQENRARPISDLNREYRNILGLNIGDMNEYNGAPEILKLENLRSDASSYMLHGSTYSSFNDSKSVKQATSKAVQELHHFLIGDSADTGKS